MGTRERAMIIAATITAVGVILAAIIAGMFEAINKQPLSQTINTPTAVLTQASPTKVPTSSATTQSTGKAQRTFPLAAGLNGFRTDQSYVGTITLMVSGTGQAKQTALSDPLYIYTDFNENPVTPYHDPHFSLCINYKPVDNYWQSLPNYSPTHTYMFNITIPAPGGNLVFGICDDGVSDNTGSFTVTISQ